MSCKRTTVVLCGVLAVLLMSACADKRGFRARPYQDANRGIITEQTVKDRGGLGGTPTATANPTASPSGAPVLSSPAQPPPPAPPPAAVVSGGDAVGSFATLVSSCQRDMSKVNQLVEALDISASTVIHGVTPTAKVIKVNDQTKSAEQVAVDVLALVSVNGEEKHVNAVGLVDVVDENSCDENRAKTAKLDAKYVAGSQDKVDAPEVVALAVCSKNCAEVYIIIEVKSKDATQKEIIKRVSAKYATQADSKDAQVLNLTLMGSSVGTQHKTFEDAQAAAPTPAPQSRGGSGTGLPAKDPIYTDETGYM